MISENSIVVSGQCEKCGEKLGIAYTTGITNMIQRPAERFLEDENLLMWCPNCEEFVDWNGLEIKKMDKYEVGRLIRQGKGKELI